jgi:hypothetical protein
MFSNFADGKLLPNALRALALPWARLVMPSMPADEVPESRRRADQELESGQVDSALWHHALTRSSRFGGDPRDIYLAARAAQIQEEADDAPLGDFGTAPAAAA